MPPLLILYHFMYRPSLDAEAVMFDAALIDVRWHATKLPAGGVQLMPNRVVPVGIMTIGATGTPDRKRVSHRLAVRSACGRMFCVDWLRYRVGRGLPPEPTSCLVYVVVLIMIGLCPSGALASPSNTCPDTGTDWALERGGDPMQ